MAPPTPLRGTQMVLNIEDGHWTMLLVAGIGAGLGFMFANYRTVKRKLQRQISFGGPMASAGDLQREMGGTPEMRRQGSFPARRRGGTLKAADGDAKQRSEWAERIDQAMKILDRLKEDPQHRGDLQFVSDVFSESAMQAAAATAAHLLAKHTPQDVEIQTWVANNYAPLRRYRESQQTVASSLLSQESDKFADRKFSEAQVMFGLHIDAKTQPKLNKCLAKATEWTFDIFVMKKLTGGPTLAYLTYHMLERYSLPEKFNVDPVQLKKFLLTLQDGYMDNPYHNALHAADVMQTFTYLVSTGGMSEHLTDLDVFAGIIASAAHDLAHPGVNNGFLVNTSADLAYLYNDQSILENHHCATLFNILRDSKFDILEGMDASQKTEFRQLVITMILATDMAKHFEALARFKGRLATKTPFDASVKKDRDLLLEVAIHVSDLSNPAKPEPLCTRWADKITEEFYQQGDKEKEIDLPVSIFCDRNKPQKEKCQIGFIDVIVKPLFSELASGYPKLQECLDTLSANREMWVALEQSRGPSSST
eukprot:GFYU01006720.1.p1 GENE.GFYU01006720.1~~GFYU01006720.1.p1  ORF type:complete len:536 (+),score=130.95 GFYU01006720.1:349-1956(+)